MGGGRQLLLFMESPPLAWVLRKAQHPGMGTGAGAAAGELHPTARAVPHGGARDGVGMPDRVRKRHPKKGKEGKLCLQGSHSKGHSWVRKHRLPQFSGLYLPLAKPQKVRGCAPSFRSLPSLLCVLVLPGLSQDAVEP